MFFFNIFLNLCFNKYLFSIIVFWFFRPFLNRNYFLIIMNVFNFLRGYYDSFIIFIIFLIYTVLYNIFFLLLFYSINFMCIDFYYKLISIKIFIKHNLVDDLFFFFFFLPLDKKISAMLLWLFFLYIFSCLLSLSSF